MKTLYDYKTCSFNRDVSLVGLNFYDLKMCRNDDGSVDDYLHINVACFGRIDECR